MKKERIFFNVLFSPVILAIYIWIALKLAFYIRNLTSLLSNDVKFFLH